MRVLLLKVIIILMPVISFCQNEQHNLKICSSRNPVLIYIYGGLVFEPLNESSNVLNPVLCNAYEEEFYLNGLQINKEEFNKLNLSDRDLSNDSTTFFIRRSSKRGYGTYEYNDDKENYCANKMIYRIDTKLSIFLNGIELDKSEQKDRLSKVKSDNITAFIIRKTTFYKKGKIEITTK